MPTRSSSAHVATGRSEACWAACRMRCCARPTVRWSSSPPMRCPPDKSMPSRPKRKRRVGGLVQWTDTHAAAWIGLLETHKHLTRELEAELEAEHGLSISSLE